MFNSKIRFASVPSPRKGLNDLAHRDSLSDEYTSDCKDVIYQDGWVKQRKGLAKVNTSAGPGSTHILGQAAFVTTGPSGRRRHLVHTNGNIYERTGSSINSTVLAGFPIDEPVRFATGLNRILLSNGEVIPSVWDGSVMSQISEAPFGRFPVFYNDYHWLMHIRNQSNGPSLAYNSNLRDVYNWDTDDVWNIETHDGEEITGSAVEGPYLAIFKPSSRTLLRGNFFDQSSAAFDGSKAAILRGIGSMSHTGLIQANGLLYTPDASGIYALNGGRPVQRVTDPIPRFWGRVNQSVGHKIHGVHWRQKKWLLWSLPLDGAGSPNFILVYDYQNGGLWPWEIDSHSMISYVEDDGVEHVYIGRDNGFILDLYATDSDDGTAIDSHIDWPDMGRSTRTSNVIWEGVRLVLRNDGTNTLTTKFYADGKHSLADSVSITATQAQASPDEEFAELVSCSQVGRTLRCRVSNSTDAATWGLREMAPAGRLMGYTI